MTQVLVTYSITFPVDAESPDHAREIAKDIYHEAVKISEIPPDAVVTTTVCDAMLTATDEPKGEHDTLDDVLRDTTALARSHWRTLDDAELGRQIRALYARVEVILNRVEGETHASHSDCARAIVDTIFHRAPRAR